MVSLYYIAEKYPAELLADFWRFYGIQTNPLADLDEGGLEWSIFDKLLQGLAYYDGAISKLIAYETKKAEEEARARLAEREFITSSRKTTSEITENSYAHQLREEIERESNK